MSASSGAASVHIAGNFDDMLVQVHGVNPCLCMLLEGLDPGLEKSRIPVESAGRSVPVVTLSWSKTVRGRRSELQDTGDDGEDVREAIGAPGMICPGYHIQIHIRFI